MKKSHLFRSLSHISAGFMLGFLLLAPLRGQLVSTVAGGATGDGAPATSAALDFPRYLALDGSDNLFISDSIHNRIRKVDSTGVISTVAGTGLGGYSGDGGAAVDAALNLPAGILFDGAGNLIIADQFNDVIRRVDGSGIITTIAGTGTAGYSGDGGAAIAAQLDQPFGLALDATGDLLFADLGNSVIRKINFLGIITTVAGNGVSGYGGDGGPATAASLNSPRSILPDGSGNLYIADTANRRVRKVDTAGVITTIAGNGLAKRRKRASLVALRAFQVNKIR